jgi:hypothetical protein
MLNQTLAACTQAGEKSIATMASKYKLRDRIISAPLQMKKGINAPDKSLVTSNDRSRPP